MIKHYTQIPVTPLGDILSRHFSGSREAVNTAYPKLFGLVKMYMEAIQPDFSFIENQKECHIVLPYVTRIAQEIAIALERMQNI